MPDDSIPAVLLRTAADHPESLAFIGDGIAVSYDSMVRAAMGVTRLLDDGASTPVTVIAPLGPLGFVLHLGVLLSGRTCVPLGTDVDDAMVLRILSATSGPVLAASAAHRRALDGDDRSRLRVDASIEDLASGSVLPDPSNVPAVNDPALICFTSGSTGTPKGVSIPHRQLLEAAEFSDTHADDVVGVSSPPSFFASTLQTLAALTVAAKALHLDLSRRRPSELVELARRHGLTHFTGTTTHVRELARATESRPLRSLRRIDLGGEPTTRADLERFRVAFPSATIRNIYGSSEAGRATSWECRPSDPLPPDGPIPAGRADPSRSVAVLDAHGHETPAGEIGRIALLRPEPFLGYWNDPGSTAALLVNRPDGHAWILTGDNGHLDPDGNLRVVGRNDDRVKVHGRFVVPSEIDTVLLEHPGLVAVRTIAVPRDVPTALVTFVATAEEERPDDGELRTHLVRRLGSAALPARIERVRSLPVTARGKVDVDELHRLADSGASEEASARARRFPLRRRAPRPVRARPPATAAEAIVQATMGELLGGIIVGADDDFFALGGDSLAAAALIDDLSRRFATELSPADLIRDATPRALALVLNGPPSEPPDPHLIPLHESDGPGTIFWITPGANRFGPGRLARGLPEFTSYCCLPLGAASPVAPHRDLDEAADRHPSLRHAAAWWYRNLVADLQVRWRARHSTLFGERRMRVHRLFELHLRHLARRHRVLPYDGPAALIRSSEIVGRQRPTREVSMLTDVRDEEVIDVLHERLVNDTDLLIPVLRRILDRCVPADRSSRSGP